MPGKIKGWSKSLPVVLLVILLAVVILRLPSLFEPRYYGDEDIYLTVGMGIRKGLVLYKDVFDNKPPLIYLMGALAGSFFWFRVILLLWNLLSVTLFYDLAILVMRDKTKAEVSTMVFAVMSTIPLFEGQIVNSEVLFILTTITGWLLVWRELKLEKTNMARWLAAGTSMGVGVLFKMPALVDVLGLVFVAVILAPKILVGIKRAVWLSIGATVPLALSILGFVFTGAVAIYLKSAFWELFPYLSSWGNKGASQGSGLGLRAVLLSISCMILLIARKKFSTALIAVSAWMIFAIFGALLSGRPYPHYLMQVVPPLSFIFVWLLMGDKREGIFATVHTLIFAGIFCAFRFWYYPTYSYYEAFIRFAVGRTSRDEYSAVFEKKALWYRPLVEFIKATTSSKDRIFVWGTDPAIYVFSKRLPASRYTVAYHVHEKGAEKEVMGELEKNKPRLIVLVKGEGEFDELSQYISREFLLVGEFGEAQVFRRMESLRGMGAL